MRERRSLSAPAFKLAAAQALALVYALLVPTACAEDCYKDFERAQGATGYKAVPWKPCCTKSATQVEDPSRGWGKFCVPSPNVECYKNGQRAQGAEGYPNVPWKPCCDRNSDQVEDAALGWGKFCKLRKLPSGNSAQTRKGANTAFASDKAGGRTGEWTTVAAKGAPVPRHEATFVMADNGKAYLLGGRGIRPVSVYDLATNTWTEASKPPVEIHHFQAVYHKGLIWIPAAWTGPYPREKNLDKFYVYNVSSDKWSTRTPLQESRRRGAAAVAFYKGKLYVAMGNRGGHGSHATTLGWLDVYDPKTDSWNSNSYPDAPNGRDHTGGGFIGDSLCVAGGRDGGKANFFYKNIGPTNCYNVTAGTWASKPSIPEPRAGSSYGVDCGGRLVVAGGEGSGKAYDRVDYFNGDTWDTPTKLKTARHGSGVAVEGCGCCACKDLYIASGSGAQGGFPEIKSLEKFKTADC